MPEAEVGDGPVKVTIRTPMRPANPMIRALQAIRLLPFCCGVRERPILVDRPICPVDSPYEVDPRIHFKKGRGSTSKSRSTIRASNPSACGHATRISINRHHHVVITFTVCKIKDAAIGIEGVELNVRLHGHGLPPELPGRHVHVIVRPVEHHAVVRAGGAVFGRRCDGRVVGVHDIRAGRAATEIEFVIGLRDVQRPHLVLRQCHAVPEAEVGDGPFEVAIVITSTRSTDPVIAARHGRWLLPVRFGIGERPILVQLHRQSVDRRHDMHPYARLVEGR